MPSGERSHAAGPPPFSLQVPARFAIQTRGLSATNASPSALRWARARCDRPAWAFDQFQDQRDRVGSGFSRTFPEAVDRADVGMIERRQHLRFAAEPREPLGIVRDIGQQDFQRDVAIELRSARAIHLAHPPAPSGAEISYGPRRAPGNKFNAFNAVRCADYS